MQTDPIVQCPNYFCQALNSESQRFCRTCQTRISKRYLWAVGATYPPGKLIDDRFLIKTSQIVLDTKPGIPPTSIEVSPALEPYLHLMAERPVIPQPFAVVKDLLLLELAPIYPGDAHPDQGEDLAGQLMPLLTQVWDSSQSFRQLHILWQLAQLWRVLAVEKCAATLLNPNLLFVDGDTVRVLELSFDQAPVPNLADLGKVWSTWKPHAAIAEFFNQICQDLIQGQMTQIDQLIDQMDHAISVQAQQQTRSVQIATLSDQGPSRQGNEDACYPPSGTSSADSSTDDLLVIVCDGIGGHEGGEVASNLAIQTIVRALETSSDDIQQDLEESVFLANDAIAQKNDTERRQERQRMGTTVVMGFVRSHELYLTHIGDSRAYRITRQGCYQVTLDDDVASREARLGYSLYRDALQHPSAGSLVQALGMGSSSYLRPTVQRFLLDEDCVFLLCSDGLSDNDRVEECWQTEIVPLLNGKSDGATVARNLVEIANTQNGHDNVTIGLIHCQTRSIGQSKAVSLKKPIEKIAPSSQQATGLQQRTGSQQTAGSQQRTEFQPRRLSRSSFLKIALILVGLFGAAGAITAVFVPELIPMLIDDRRPAATSVTVPPVPASPDPLALGTLIRLDRPGLPLLKKIEPLSGNTPRESFGQIPPGTILQVVGRQQGETERSAWIRLKVCTLGTPAVKVPNSVESGKTGWQQETAIVSSTKPDLKSSPLGACTATLESPKQNVSPTP